VLYLLAVNLDTQATGRRERLLRGLFSAGLALYLGRIWLEFGPEPARWAVAGLLVLAGFLVAMFVQARWRLSPSLRSGQAMAPLSVCWLYVVWPWIDPGLAGAVGFVAGVALLTSLPRWQPRRLVFDLAVFTISLGVYIATLAPTVLPADAGEFQLVARTLGIAHPPGYPLYTLGGWLFTWLPVGDAAYRVNLFSAVTSAATLAVVSATVRRLTGSTGAGLVAALALGASTTFWAQATTANIRSLTALFTALFLLILIRYGHDRRLSDLTLFAFVFGLGLGHHGSLGFLLLPAAGYLLLVMRATRRVAPAESLVDGRQLARMAGAFALALSVLLYLPVRGAMDPPLNPGGLTTAGGFVRHVLALGFQGDFFYFSSLSRLPDRLAVLANILDIQFGLLLLIVAGLGLVVLAIRAPRDALLVGGIVAVNALVAITYRAPQTVEYLMPAYVGLAVLIGQGARFVISDWESRNSPFAVRGRQLSVQAITLAVLLLLGARNAWANWASYRALSQDRSARDSAAELLTAAPEGALILAGWHQVTPLWYLQTVEGLRPDVQVSYVAPRGAEPIGVTWQRRLVESADQRPTITTNRFPEFAGLPFVLASFHGAYLAGAQPNLDLPTDASQPASEVVFGDRFRLRGFHLSALPGGLWQVTLYWQPLVPGDRDYATFVHLVDATGRVWGQHDTTYPATAWSPNQLLTDVHVMPVLSETPPGRYQVIAGVYTIRPDGKIERLATEAGDSFTLASVEVEARHQAPVTCHPLFQPFAGGPTLVGADYDLGRPESLRLYLHWFQPADSSFQVQVLSRGQPVANGTVPGGPGYVTTAHDLPAGAADLSVEVVGRAALGPFGLPWAAPWAATDGRPYVKLPEPAPGERWLNFGGELALTRAEVTPAQPGGQAVVDLEFVGLRPLTRDYSVSVQVPGWAAQSDGTPALGAIPTLKWIRGTQVADRHRLTIPADAGTSSVTVTVYDAFTLEPLVVLDDRALKAGEGTRVTVGEVVATW
jgi:hypothetical protein